MMPETLRSVAEDAARSMRDRAMDAVHAPHALRHMDTQHWACATIAALPLLPREEADARALAQVLPTPTMADADLRDQIAEAITRAGREIDVNALGAAMNALAPVLAARDKRIRELEGQLEDARAESARESSLVSEARHERDTAQQEARKARREAAALIAGHQAAATSAIRDELDDMDPDCRMRDLASGRAPGEPDPGIPGNTWWRAYCEVGGMMRALAAVEAMPDTTTASHRAEARLADAAAPGRCPEPDCEAERGHIGWHVGDTTAWNDSGERRHIPGMPPRTTDATSQRPAAGGGR